MRKARSIDGVARREVIGAIEHDRGVRHSCVEPCIVDALRDRIHHHVGIELGDRVAPGFDLAAANRSRHVQNLALQVGEIDGVGIYQRQLAHARRGQIHRRWRAQPTRADDDRMCIEKTLLRLDTEFVDKNMAGIAEKLIVVHGGAQGGSRGGGRQAGRLQDQALPVARVFVLLILIALEKRVFVACRAAKTLR